MAEESGATSWGSISRHLQGQIFPVKLDDKRQPVDISGKGRVIAPATDVNFEATLNWQSPFENAGPESKAPQLMALIQSGQLAPVVDAINGFAKEYAPAWASSKTENLGAVIKNKSAELEGKTGITKLNSRQIFSGMPPIKISMKLHFRALMSGKDEVEAPYRQLLEWALPQKLADDGVLVEVIKAATNDPANILNKLFPSTSPQMVGFMYGNEKYTPMVIESISTPIDGPRDYEGYPVYKSVQLTLATLTALDKADVANIYQF